MGGRGGGGGSLPLSGTDQVMSDQNDKYMKASNN